MGIQEIRETTESCKHCFMCRHACPTFLATKLDSHTPRGYALLLSEIDHGYQKWTASIVERFYQCSLCGLCREDCGYHWAEDEVVRNAREEIVAADLQPPRVKEVAASVMGKGTLYGGERGAWKPASGSLDKKRAGILYFAGCAARESHPEILRAVDKLMGALNADWTVLGEEGCCGASLYDLGYTKDAKAVAEKLAQKIRTLQPGLLLTGCPHCLRALSELYPAWGIQLPKGLVVQHVSQYLETQYERKLLKVGRVQGLSRVCYHDPCQLGRKKGIYDAPRRLVEAATGSPPLELFHDREKAECCGAGSSMHVTDQALSRRIAEKRIERMREVDSSVVVTACQNCKTSFLGSGRGSAVRAIDLVELLAMGV
jgi:heterodisulfide reductase subunit D